MASAVCLQADSRRIKGIFMKMYDELKIEVYLLQEEDVIRTSFEGEVEGDETKYPVPGDWLE